MVLEDIKKSFGQLGAYVFGSQQTLAKSTSSNSHALMPDDEVEDALAGEVIQTDKKESSKRGRGSESEEAARKKVKAGPSADEKRLAGDYNVPSTAKAIPMPTSADRPGTPRPADSRTMGAAKPSVAGGFRPRNTLDQAPHAAAKNGGKKHAAFYTGVPATQPLATKAVAGSDVATQKRYITGHSVRPGADGFESGPSVKRQKIEHANGNAGMPHPVIDISDDGGEQLHRPGAALKATYKDNQFNSEIRAADGMIGSFEKPHKQRKRKDRDHSSSKTTSVSGSEVEVLSSRSSMQPGSRRSPMVLVDTNEARNIAPKAPPGRRKIDQSGTQGPADMPSRPDIRLGDGVDDYEGRFTKTQDGSGGRFRSLDNAPESAKQNQPRARRAHNSPRESDSEQSSSKASAQEGARQQQARRQQESQATSAKTRDKFVRDDQAQGQPRNVIQRMQAASVRPSSRDSIHSDSADELQGSTTVNGTASRRLRGVERPISPETQVGSKSRKLAGSTTRSSNRDHDNAQQASSCRLAAFYCLGGNFTGDRLELKYDERENRLELYDGVVPVPLAGRKGVVGLDESDVKQLYWCKGNPCAVLQGLQGKACLNFADLKSFQRFWSYVSAVNERCVFHPEPDDIFDKRFRNVTGTIRDQQKRAEAELARQNKQLQNHAMLRTLDDEEEIQYEQSDEDQRAPRRRDLMQPGSAGGAFKRALKEAEAGKLVRESARAQQNTISPYFDQEPRRSSRQSKLIKKRTPTPELVKWTERNKPRPWSQPVTYPASGVARATVDFADLQRLDEGEFLNDNVVGFALLQIAEKMAPEFKDQVHWFNTFFYTTLSTKNNKKAFNYDGVKRWTKNKDLFSMPYVVVPICQEFHWYVCIICNLDKLKRTPVGVKDDGETKPAAEDTNTLQIDELKDDEDAVQVVSVAQGVGQDVEGLADGVKKQSLSDTSGDSSRHASPGNTKAKAGNAGDYDEVKVAAKPAANRKGKKRPPTRTYDPDTPLIITLDSLGLTHAAELRNLKEYVCCEAEAKRGMKVGREALQGLTAKGLPEQTNFCDCGVYVVGYMEQFAQDPAKFVEKVASRQLDREEDFASFDPNAKRAQIRESLLALAAGQEDEADDKKNEKAVENAGSQTENAAKVAQHKSPSPRKPLAAQTRPLKELLADVRNATRDAQKATPVLGAPVASAKQSLKETPPALPPRRTAAAAADGDELEMSVPTALSQPKPLSRPTSSAGKPPTMKVGPFEEEESEDEDGEMLDNGKSSGSDDSESSPAQNTAPAMEEPLLIELERQNNAGQTISRPEQTTECETKTFARVASANAPRRSHMGERSAELSIITIDDSQDGIAGGQAEIADSQELTPRHRSPVKTYGKGKGKHTIFAD